MENKHVIIILLIVIAVLAAAIGFAFLNPTEAKEPTKIKIISDKEQDEGGELKIKLTDMNKTPISKQIVNITITNKKGNVVVDDVVKTDKKGKAKLDLDLKKGKYKVNVTYGGNENYTGNNTTQKLKIKEKEKVAEAEVESSDSPEETYTYSRQQGKYIKDSGEWSEDGKTFTYKGDDGVLYQKYYDGNGNPVSSEEHYR